MRYWIAVASREHVLCGVEGGFCQVCHGKGEPLKKMQPQDFLIYYSPKERFQEKEPCQKFTAIGKILAKEPYLFQMSKDFAAGSEQSETDISQRQAAICKAPLQRFPEADDPKEGRRCRATQQIADCRKRDPLILRSASRFTPWRRDVMFYSVKETPIEPLIDELSFITNKERWGFPFIRGCFSISQKDFQLIALQMEFDETYR